jgi:hypothetical protein
MVMRLQSSRSGVAMAGKRPLISFGLRLEKVQHARSLKGKQDTAMRKA